MGQRSIVRAFIATMLLAAGFALAPAAGVAQDATPAMEGGMGMGPHPAHIHAGRCPDVGDVVFPLTDVTDTDMTGTPMAGMEDMEDSDSTPMADMESSPMAGMEDKDDMDEVVATSTTDVDASLEDILGAEHAINVHLSPDQIDVYIACGDITGEPEDGALEIELAERNDSGYEGEAYLTDNGDGTTTVDVMLMRADDDEMMQEATPTP
jgi:hypothetical protein